MENIVFFDLETTGFHKTDEILSISMVNQKEEVLLDTLVKPVQKASWENAEKVHHISPEMVGAAPTIDELKDRINEIVMEADLLVSYNINFDYRFIRDFLNEDVQKKLKVDCCLEKARRCCPNVSHKLGDMMAWLKLEWKGGTAHSSLPDAIACKDVWFRLNKM